MRFAHHLALFLLGSFLLLPIPDAIWAQDTLTENVETDPQAAKFVFDDVRNFLAALDAIAGGEDTVAALQRVYLDRASPGLLLYIEKYDLSTDRLLAAMREQPEAYGDIHAKLQALVEALPTFRSTYSDIQDIIPAAVFPPTYFLVAGHRGIGSGSTEGPLLSVEKEDPSRIEATLPATLVHEMIHMQQLAALGPDYFVIFSGPERTLLATSIREGVATFFSEIITGGSEHKNLARDFLLANEARLWHAFEKEMLGSDMGDWLWRDPTDPEQPQDVGYALGARIAEAYYEAADNKGEAAYEVLAVRDYEAFLAASGYADRFR